MNAFHPLMLRVVPNQLAAWLETILLIQKYQIAMHWVQLLPTVLTLVALLDKIKEQLQTVFQLVM